MNDILALNSQPNVVLVALLNCINKKVYKSGKENPICVKIFQILQKRGVNLDSVHLKNGTFYSFDRSQNRN